MRTRTPSGIEISATLIGSYHAAGTLHKTAIMCAFEPGQEISPEDDENIFDWLLAPFALALKHKSQIVEVHAERWNNPESGRPRVTYEILWDMAADPDIIDNKEAAGS